MFFLFLFRCDGGFSKLAWKYLQAEGVVSGGPWKSGEVIRPLFIWPLIYQATYPASQASYLTFCCHFICVVVYFPHIYVYYLFGHQCRHQ